MAFASYTFHVPPGVDPDDPDAAEQVSVVRDGFSVGAFLVPMLWFFAHRHWLAGFVALFAVLFLAIGLWLTGFGLGPIVAAEFLLHLLIGFEGASIRRWLLARRGRPVADVVSAASREEAEVKSFGRWFAATLHRPSVPAAVPTLAGNASAASRYAAEPIIGLFPDPAGRPGTRL